ncbi:valine--tRNA ligase [Megalodesulfovibrio gigas]|uniref:Valine--tRNA ligase n=1 Tax=Megalodesulfovibrio gigas (strain ATCC 19364 / DSM 1382 / NCIMB 9332 / VKM B-1759) TaxID=1121448 RepID=T2GB01_MEGG1|nr:valine--tRNA ligase [Megalodesulfovibrio gigas]AGW13473.1 putative valyl-tRNA synthetase [Megalodesulfovibrio gigas DSM 1382 = ATCC 19364]
MAAAASSNGQEPVTLPKGYDPKDVESRWSAWWEERGSFIADPDAPGAPYSIVIPPPNVTGSLHMGHALNLTLQDILCRHHRQLGRKVLWVPGMDHAGIATQNVVERMLAKEGVSRHDLGRDAFIERVWQWKEEYGGRILNQIRRMGASVDWSRQRFTLDEGLSRAVREVFVTLYEDGLIYKGKYLVNWCIRCHTALADDEVEFTPKKGVLYQIKYPTPDGTDGLVVATSRPETMLGDTAVCVHPEDERYLHLHGKTVRLPLTDREIPVITDTYVEKDFGTGALKVTPAHDPNDWELGRRHGLEVISVQDDEGFINENAPERFRGLAREQARAKVLAELAELGLLVGQTEYDHNVGVCYRCKSVIEPHVSPQWFVKVKPLAEEALAAVTDGRTSIHPESWTKTYNHWLENIRDWCISRQLWWGHRIPAWTCDGCGEVIVARETPTTCPKCQGSQLVQDEDVLDTWFSSALWPFSTLGWPDNTKDLAAFYPTSVLVTAFDIIFFWVARMMMMGTRFMGQPPFKDVYIHALVRDAEGKKMSKSTGNVIDPLDMIDRFGTDSLRFTFAAFAAMGRDIRLSEERIEGYRHFVNKLWNAARFSLMHLPEAPAMPAHPLHETPGVHHAWLFHRLEELKTQVQEAIAGYYFNEAAQALYSFIWHEFCDWYLEMIKPELSGEDDARKQACRACLWTGLTETLVLLHPIMPFVTQEIWSCLPGVAGEDLSAQPYPERRPQCVNPRAAHAFSLIQESVVAIRAIRGELNISPGLELAVLIQTANEEDAQLYAENAGMLSLLARCKAPALGTQAAPVNAPRASATAVVQGNVIFVPLAGAVDFETEIARLDKELAKLDKEITIVNKKLANEGFRAKAPAEVVAKEKEKVEMMSDKSATLQARRARLVEARDDATHSNATAGGNA